MKKLGIIFTMVFILMLLTGCLSMSIDKTADKTEAAPGDTIRYTVTVKVLDTGEIGNGDDEENGEELVPQSFNIEILPPEEFFSLMDVMVTDSLVELGADGIIGTMHRGEERTIEYDYVVPEDFLGELINTATVTWTQNIPNLPDPDSQEDDPDFNEEPFTESVTFSVMITEGDPSPETPAPVEVIEVEALVEEIEVLAEVEEPIRTKALTVWQVNCLDNNQLEFIFLYPYRDNNWLTIYDGQGNEVYREDISYSNPRTVVELPDGMYTVKTFKSEGRIIQEFSIGLPCDAAAPIAVEDVAELPYTGFNYLPFAISAALLAGLGALLMALRKQNLNFFKK